MKPIIAFACAVALVGCAAEPGSDVKETKASGVKVNMSKEKQDEIAAKFKAGNFKKK